MRALLVALALLLPGAAWAQGSLGLGGGVPCYAGSSCDLGTGALTAQGGTLSNGAAGTSATAALTLKNSAGIGFQFVPQGGNAVYNPLVSTNDQVIVSGAAVGTSNVLTLAPWSSTRSGLRLLGDGHVYSARNILDDGFGNVTLAGALSSTGTWTGSFAAGTNFDQFVVNDSATATSSAILGAHVIQYEAPNGTSASGSRIAFGVDLVQQGSSGGGSISNASGEDSAMVVTMRMDSNLGGTSTLYGGTGNAGNFVCNVSSTGTDLSLCNALELDVYNKSASINGMSGLLIASLGGDTVEPREGPGYALVVDNAAAGVNGFSRGITFGTLPSNFPITPYGTLFLAQGTVNGAASVSTAYDVSDVTVHGCYQRSPYASDCNLTLTGVTAATRMTTDGGAPIGYIQAVRISAQGTGYTGFPTATVSGCAATVNFSVGGGVVGDAGVYTNATNCPSNTSISLSGGGGTGAAASVVIDGNTLNFPINSTVEVRCEAVAQNSTNTEQLGEHIYFGATQGATPGSVAILGTPAWVSDFSVGTPTISFNAPAADTTLGAINLTATPTAGTWNIGGSCHVTRTTQT